MNTKEQSAANNGTATKMAELNINSNQPDIAQMSAFLYGKKTDATSDPTDQGNQGDSADPGAPGKAEAPPVEDEAYLASQICLVWNKSLDGVLEVGRLLNRAAGMMGKRPFKNRFVAQLPFTYSVAQRLRKLAKSKRINDPRYRPLMPFSWNTLAAIDNLTDAAFQHGIEHGIITSKCEFKRIKKLRDEFPEPQAEATGSSSGSGSGASSATVEAPKGRYSSRLQKIKERTAAWEEKLKNKPRPLFLSVFSVTLEYHRPELAKLVEELNQRLPQEYPFISEVSLEERK